MKRNVFLCIVSLFLMSGVCFAVNPYGTCGSFAYGGFENLDLPDGCESYDWNNLYPGYLYNMIRPYPYWETIGIFYQYWGYDPILDVMGRDDSERTLFANWIQANPGKIYLLGNEPSRANQDNLTADSYAKMFKTARTFILQYDSTAKFAVAAYDISYPTLPWTSTRDNLNAVLNAYKTQNGGEAMPIDEWTMHLYITTAEANANTAIAQYDNLANWMRTVDGGRYADCPINITEFGVNGAAAPESFMIDYMNAICPLLEQRVKNGQLNRFFWFTSSWFDDSTGKWSKNCLVDSNYQPNALGLAYKSLADAWQEPASVEDWAEY